MTTQADEALLTVAEAALALKVSTATVHRWLKQGRLPAFHIGSRAVGIRRADLARVMRPVQPQEPAWVAEPLATMLRAIRPPTAEQWQQALTALADARALGETIRERTGAVALAESWSLINEARDAPSAEQ